MLRLTPDDINEFRLKLLSAVWADLPYELSDEFLDIAARLGRIAAQFEQDNSLPLCPSPGVVADALLVAIDRRHETSQTVRTIKE